MLQGGSFCGIATLYSTSMTQSVTYPGEPYPFDFLTFFKYWPWTAVDQFWDQDWTFGRYLGSTVWTQISSIVKVMLCGQLLLTICFMLKQCRTMFIVIVWKVDQRQIFYDKIQYWMSGILTIVTDCLVHLTGIFRFGCLTK